MKKYRLIANPEAGRGRVSALVPRVLALFEARGASIDLAVTKSPRDAARIARESLDRYDAIVVLGGDGTVNEVLEPMLFARRPLGIIPAGSGNDFVKSLKVPANLEQAVDTILRGTTRVIDAGRINGRYFVNAAGIGFDAAVNQASYAINHSRRGLLLYLCALLRTLGRYDPVPMTVTMNGEQVDENVFLLTAGNGTTVGGGFRLTPHAALDDQLLDVTLVRAIGLLPLLWHLPKVFLGTLDRVTKYAVSKRTARLVIESSLPVPVHLDGEIYTGAERRFEIEVVPRALTVIGNF
ncbi:MAG: hypothetical protein A2010_08745 [Nitrospirae bacterium GWD2_57_9]|nr:MAG: hypothetical protein A2010_08745 [Nitrospirae bacterium GWD2_57_9]